MVENKCKKCGSLMVFNTAAKASVCKSCGNSIPVNLQRQVEIHDIDFNRLIGTSSSYKTEIKTQGLKCRNCGATPSKKVSNIAAKCEYCGASMFIDDDGGMMPDGCVLFELDKETAVTKFKEGIRAKKFIPSAFRRNPSMDKIEAIYFPAFTFSAVTSSNYIGRLRTRGEHRDYYSNVSGIQNFVYNDILLEGSNYLTQNEFKSVEPYDLGKLYKFDKAVINGYSVEYYNRTIEEAGKLAKEIMEKRIRNSIITIYDANVSETIDKLEIQTAFAEGKYSYLLLPAYKVTYKYGKKEYSTFVNGQTGKVGGRVPLSKFKIFSLILAIMLVAGGIIGAILKSSAINFLLDFFK